LTQVAKDLSMQVVTLEKQVKKLEEIFGRDSRMLLQQAESIGEPCVQLKEQTSIK
jgi:hypothetical protein